MRTHSLTVLCIGVILTIGSVGAQSDGGYSKVPAAFETVDRIHKSDRLPLPRAKVIVERSSGLELPEGCDGLVSPLSNRQLGRVAAHCES
jgi:hypothetical protein